MTLQTFGPLPASDINNELNRPRTTTFDINAADSRRLAQTGTVNMYTPARPSTTPGTFIAYSQFYGASNEIPVQFLVVAGGGGGGGAAGVGGGGGAGGVLNFTANVIPIPGGTISVTVGAGGAGGPGGPSGIFSDGSKGSNSSVRYTNSSGTTTRTAEGGGGGGGGETTTAVNQRASSGGSGGGGGRNRYASNPGSPYLGGAGASGQGNAGGNGFGTASQDIASSGGGGGGAGGAGGAGSSNQGGRGGGGVALTIGALRFEVAGGGGGGAFGGSGATGGVPGSNPSGAAGVAGLGGGAGAGDGGAPPSFSATPFWTVEQNMNASYVTDWRMGKGGRVLATVTANSTGTFNRGVPNGTTYPAYITYQTEPRWGSNQLRSYAVYFDPNPKLYWYRNWNTTDATQPAPFDTYTAPAGWTATGFNITFPGTGTRTYRFLWSFDSYIFQMDIGSVTNALSGANTRFHRWTQTTDITLPAGTPQACQMRFNYGIQPLGSRGITVHIYAPTGSGGGNPGGSAVINAAMRTGYGSGGGGAGGGGLVISGGAGARGVVALAYEGTTARSTGGTVTVSGRFVHHVFTTSGTFRWT